VPRVRTKRTSAKQPAKRVIRRLENDERRAQLLALGQAAFVKHAYDEVSIDELARKAKISKGLFYYYFPTKRDLYLAGLSAIAEDLVAKVVSVPRDLPPRPRATAAVEAYLDNVAGQGAAFLSLMRGGLGSDPEVSKVVEGVRAKILDEFLINAPIGALLGNKPIARVAIRGWIGMVEAASTEWLVHQQVSREAVRELLIDQLFELLTRLIGQNAERFR
jgi:AcrR family transcriptional regulator